MTSTAGMLPVLSYARISDDGENDAHGVRNQHRENRLTAARLGWTIVHEFTDNDRSASKAHVIREQFEEMLTSLRAGALSDGTPICGVVIVAEDRLVRRAGDYERFVEAVTAKDGRVYADQRGPKDLYSEDVEGLGLVGVAFSKIESRKMRRRARQWHRSRAQDGQSPGGTRPFGWRADDRTALEPIEAALLARAVNDFIAGRALHSIVMEWNAKGMVTTRGNPWTPQALKLALTNPRICGWRKLGGELVRDGAGNPVLGMWEPIVSPDHWLAASSIIESRKGLLVSPGGNVRPLPYDFRAHKHLLTGTLRCGKIRADGSTCGARLRVVYQRDCVQHIYACPPKSAGGCAGVGRRGDMVDSYVTEAVLAKLDERGTAILEIESAAWTGEAELNGYESRLVTLRQQWTKGEASDSMFFATARELEQRIQELRNEQARCVTLAMRASAGVADVRARWDSGDLDVSQKRAYVREALDAVIVRPAGKGRRAFDPNLLEPIWR